MGTNIYFIEVNGDVFLISDLTTYKGDNIGTKIYGVRIGSHNLLSQMYVNIWKALASTDATCNTTGYKWSQRSLWIYIFAG